MLQLNNKFSENCNPDDSTKCAKQLLTPRDYFCIRKMTYWEGTPIKQVSAGYSKVHLLQKMCNYYLLQIIVHLLQKMDTYIPGIDSEDINAILKLYEIKLGENHWICSWVMGQNETNQSPLW